MTKQVQVVNGKIESINGTLVQVSIDGVPQEIINVDVSDELYDLIAEDRGSYDINSELDYIPKYIYLNGEIVEDPEYQQKLNEQEQQRKAMLFLTSADVERAIYKDKGIDFDDILAMLDQYPQIDKKAVKIEFKANNFYRGNPYVNQIGQLIGYTTEDLDYLFEHGDLPQKNEN